MRGLKNGKYVVHFFPGFGLKMKLMYLEIDVILTFLKTKLNKVTKKCHSESVKNQVENAVSGEISAIQRFSGNQQY